MCEVKTFKVKVLGVKLQSRNCPKLTPIMQRDAESFAAPINALCIPGGCTILSLIITPSAATSFVLAQ